VDAALVGFDRRELVTIPPVPDVAAWDDFEKARAFWRQASAIPSRPRVVGPDGEGGRRRSLLCPPILCRVEAELVALERHPEIRLEFAPT